LKKLFYDSAIVFFIIAFAACSKTETPPAEQPKPVTPPVVVAPVNPSVSSYGPVSAKPGEDITLSGSGFGTDASKVIIVFPDGTVAEVKSVADNKIIFTVPAKTISGQLTVIISGTTFKPAQAFSLLNANGYVVKSVGISRIMLAVDDNGAMTLAELFGGGNRVILKKGGGNTMDVVGNGIGTIPDVFGVPDGTVPYWSSAIDNGVTPDTSGAAMVVKLKGFDKSKTGYNQLNLVMHKYLWVRSSGWAGYETNLAYLKINIPAGKTNSDYQSVFLKKLFSGNINVSTIELAKPKAENPYITRDQLISSGQAVSAPSVARALTARLTSILYGAYFTSTAAAINVGKPLKFEWVNAENAEVTKEGTYTFTARFKNIKKGGFDQVVEPADSVDKVFLRITGFNPETIGFNQLRLFIADDGFYDGGLQLIFNDKPLADPKLEFIKEVYRSAAALNCAGLEPAFKHY